MTDTGWTSFSMPLLKLARIARFGFFAAAITATPAGAQTLDKVTFGTNWVADPEARPASIQAPADGTYSQISASTSPSFPAGPHGRTAGLPSLCGKLELLHGRRHDRAAFAARPKQDSAHRGRRRSSRKIRKSSCRIRRSASTYGRTCRKRRTLLSPCSAWRDQYFLRLAQGWFTASRTRHLKPYNFNPRRSSSTSARSSRATSPPSRSRSRSRAASSRTLPARRLRLHDLFDADRDPPRDRREAPRFRAALRRRLHHRLVPLSLRRQLEGQ